MHILNQYVSLHRNLYDQASKIDLGFKIILFFLRILANLESMIDIVISLVYIWKYFRYEFYSYNNVDCMF